MTLDFDSSQRHGIFELNDDLESRLARSKARAFKKLKTTPLVIKEECYSLRGARQKLHMSEGGFLNKKLLPLGLIRRSEVNHKCKPIDTLSLAQTISWLCNVDIESVLLPREYFSSKVFASLDLRIRMDKLFNAYEGSKDFENFINRQKRMANGLNPPKINAQQRINRAMLRDWLLIESSGPVIRRLC